MPSASCVFGVRAEIGWGEEGRAKGNREGKGQGSVVGQMAPVAGFPGTEQSGASLAKLVPKMGVCRCGEGHS